ncbi:MAG: MBL fold metallo-hydrolase [Candidatus Bathyarchaeota archaeon]|nr:MBL fold metallo-hydrolase [Candidatus Bathyarchaeota archaeon]
MHTKKIGKNLYQVDLETGGIKQLICSYILCGSKPLLVESGPTNSVPHLIAALHELGIKPADIQYVAVTHVHLDHGGGAGTLLRYLPNAKVLVHPKGAPHLINPDRLWASAQSVLSYVAGLFGKPEPVPQDRITPLTEGTFDLGSGGKLSVIETPGHASHNLSFLESFNMGIFPGDAAGTYHPDFDVVVPTAPPPFYLEAALASLDKLISLNPTALYFSHFGKADQAVKRLQDYKAQLKLWAKVALDGVKANLDEKQICENILAQDPVMSRLAGYFSEHSVYSVTVMENDLRGFVEYAKRTDAERKQP